VKEYWIVRPEVKAVKVDRNPSPQESGTPTTVAAPEALECTVLPGVRVELAELFA
jgi:Uma2 family endonuclease